jgi:nucleotide-binding universal stress UspA family protein
MRRILVGLDESERAPQVLAAAIELARSVGGQLDLLRVCTLPVYPYPTGVYMVPPDILPSVLEENTRRSIEKVAEQVPAELRGSCHVKLGVPWQQICGAAVELDVDLIVVGAHGYHFIDRVLGTTAARVVNHADRTVVVVRPRDARSGAPRVK